MRYDVDHRYRRAQSSLFLHRMTVDTHTPVARREHGTTVSPLMGPPRGLTCAESDGR